MKPLLKELLRAETNDFHRRSKTREYLQARVLLALQDHGAFSNWAFVGGTALRFLYQLPRYSEDLDFSLTTPEQDARFEKRMADVQRDLRAESYEVDVKSRTGATVASAFIKFRGLLHELGLSPHPDEVFSIKVEIDTSPPVGARTETRLLRRFVMLNLLHHDRASLLAGKLHAVLTRQYTKGRDLYDLAWYLADADWPGPNLCMLNHALQQSGWTGPKASPENWRQLIAHRLDDLEWKQALKDVTPFLEREQDAALVSKETITQLLRQGDGRGAV